MNITKFENNNEKTRSSIEPGEQEQFS